MASGITITGGDIFRRILKAAMAKVPGTLKGATEEALHFLEGEAKAILETEIYGKTNEYDEDPPDKSGSDSLWASFVQEVHSLGTEAVRAELLNTSPHALFIEGGTDDEGTGSHFVPVVSAGALHWLNPQTGESVFAKGVVVQGIHPYRFMERALNENRPEVIAIYKKHVRSLFR